MHRTSETSTLPSAMSSTMPFWPWRREWDLPSTSRFARSLGLDLKQQENMTEGCQRDICGSLSAAHLRRCTARHENNSQPQATGTQSSGYSGKDTQTNILGVSSARFCCDCACNGKERNSGRRRLCRGAKSRSLFSPAVDASNLLSSYIRGCLCKHRRRIRCNICPI